MGVLKKEKNVLKLVHPGRYVEIHKKPVTAAEIMNKNPRHSVTRPDVFVFPWIVVRPDSVLKPGDVFFIVPNHALYALLKKARNSSSKCLTNGSLKIEQQTEDNDNSSEFVFQTARDFYHGMCNYGCKRAESSRGEYQSSSTRLDKVSTPMCNAGAVETRGNDDDATENGSTLTRLRSCISQSDSDRKLLRLRVTFLLPVKEK